MNHTFETAGNLLIKLAAIDRPAMRHEHQMIYDRAYFKGLLENLIVFVPEARDYVEKILDLHCYGEKYRFDKTTALHKFNKSSTTVDYFIGHTGRTYSIPLITTNIVSTSTEFGIEINRIHHKKSRCAYYYWWMKEHLKFTLDDFFTYGKENDHKMVLTTS